MRQRHTFRYVYYTIFRPKSKAIWACFCDLILGRPRITPLKAPVRREREKLDKFIGFCKRRRAPPPPSVQKEPPAQTKSARPPRGTCRPTEQNALPDRAKCAARPRKIRCLGRAKCAAARRITRVRAAHTGKERKKGGKQWKGRTDARLAASPAAGRPPMCARTAGAPSAPRARGAPARSAPAAAVGCSAPAERPAPRPIQPTPRTAAPHALRCACPGGKPLHAPRVRGAEKGAQKPSGECRRAGVACKVFRKIFRQKVGYPSGMMP